MSNESSIEIEGAGIGVLHEVNRDAKVCVVLFSAGALHRTGPFRLYVALARRLSQLGLPVLRLDQPGVGDAIVNAARPQVVLAQKSLDRLQLLTGCQRFVVGGICSAADLGWNLALRDPRIAGLVLVDPVARRTHPGFRLGKLGMVWRRGPRGWLTALRRVTGLQAGTSTAHADDSQLRDWPPPGHEAGQLKSLVDRGVEVFALYTGGAANYMTHRWQFFGGFGKAACDPRVHFLHWPECDHLFYLPTDRERLIATLGDWLRSRFGEKKPTNQPDR